jgi:hypothetical protein
VKRKILVLFLFGIAAWTTFAQSERSRGFYLDAGIGFGGVRYGVEIDDMLKSLDGAGLDRVTVSLDFSAGWAVTPNLYVVGSITGFGDRLYLGSEYFQLSTYLLAPGVRFYPLSSMKKFQLGLDAGFARMVLATNIPSPTTATSEPGFGVKISAAHDFDTTMTGPALLLGGECLVDFIEHETIAGFSLFAKFVFK